MTRQNPTKYRHAGKRKAAMIRANGGTQEHAADAAGVTRQTVSDWERNQDPEYMHHYERAWFAAAQTGGSESLQVLRQALRSGNEGSRIRAASRILATLEAMIPHRIEAAFDVTHGGKVETFVAHLPAVRIQTSGDGDENAD